jgi:hypothetical protein
MRVRTDTPGLVEVETNLGVVTIRSIPNGPGLVVTLDPNDDNGTFIGVTTNQRKTEVIIDNTAMIMHK